MLLQARASTQPVGEKQAPVPYVKPEPVQDAMQAPPQYVPWALLPYEMRVPLPCGMQEPPLYEPPVPNDSPQPQAGYALEPSKAWLPQP